jgi:hypothetical protein
MLVFRRTIAPQLQASRHNPQLLQGANSMKAGSSGSNLMIARVLHTRRAWQGLQGWQVSQSISGRSILLYTSFARQNMVMIHCFSGMASDSNNSFSLDII